MNLSSEDLLGEMHFFSNMDVDLHFLCGFDDSIAMLLDLRSTMITRVFSNSTNFLDKFLNLLASFCFVTFQTSFAADFDIIVLAISDGFRARAGGGAVMGCFNFTTARFQSCLGLFLDLLVEFMNRFFDLIATFCIVLCFFIGTYNFNYLLGNFCDRFFSMFLVCLNEMFLEFVTSNFLVT